MKRNGTRCNRTLLKLIAIGIAFIIVTSSMNGKYIVIVPSGSNRHHLKAFFLQSVVK